MPSDSSLSLQLLFIYLVISLYWDWPTCEASAVPLSHTPALFLLFMLGQGLTTLSRLALNSQFSYLTSLASGITGLLQQTQIIILLFD